MSLVFSKFIEPSLYYLKLVYCIYKLSPKRMLALVAASIAVDISQVAITLLPLQMIMFIGGGKSPHFLPSAISHLSPNKVVLIFIALYFFFLATKILMNRFMEKYLERGAIHAIEKNEKVALFQDQEKLAEKAYQSVIKSFATMAFIFLAITLVFLLLPVAAFIYTFIFSAMFSGYICIDKSTETKTRQELSVPLSISSTTALISAIIFIGVQFLFLVPPVFFQALASLILLRLISNKTNGFFLSAHNTIIQKNKFSALFFKENPWTESISNTPRSVWDIYFSKELEQTLLLKLKEKHRLDDATLNIKWEQFPQGHFLYFQVELISTLPTCKKLFIAKVYNKAKDIRAINEAEFLKRKNSKKLAPEMDIFFVSEFRCHIFDISESEEYKGSTLDLKTTMLIDQSSFSVDKKLVEKFVKSKATLERRIEEIPYELLSNIAAANIHLPSLNTFNKSSFIDTTRKALRKLPLVLNSPMPPPKLTTISKDETPLSMQWGDWNIDTLGRYWPDNINEIQRIVELARLRSSFFKDIETEDLLFASQCFQLEELVKKRRYEDAVSTLHSLVKAIEA